MDSYRTSVKPIILDPEDILDMNVYREVWMPWDNKEEDVQHLIKRGPILI